MPRRTTPPHLPCSLRSPLGAIAALAALLPFAATPQAHGQSSPAAATRNYAAGSIRGCIVVGERAAPVAAAAVRVRGTELATTTEADGSFRLLRVPPGTYELVVSGEGLTPIRIVDIVVPAGRSIELARITAPEGTRNGIYTLEDFPVHATIARESDSGADSEIVSLPQFVVTPSHYGVVQDRVDLAATLTSDELAALPQLGEDLYRTISRLPGLNADDMSAKFWVRGAPNSQVLARFDGVDLIEPFHLKDFDGAMSIVDLQTIRSIDLTTGGFTTDLGDKLAGVLIMESQSFAPGGLANSLGASVTNLRGTNQGSFAGGDGSWMVAARRGYLDLAFALGGAGPGETPRYYDVSTKVEYRLGGSHTFSLHALVAGDSLKTNQENGIVSDSDTSGEHLRSAYDSAYVWGRWQGRFGERLAGEAVLAYAHLDWKRDGGALFYGTNPFAVKDTRSLDQFDLRSDWTYTLTPEALLRAGLELRTGKADYDYELSHDRWTVRNGVWYREERRIDQSLSPNGNYGAAYLAVRLQPWAPLVIESGLRLDDYSYGAGSHLSPRMNLAYTVGDTSVRAAWGLYRQAQGLQDLALRDAETVFAEAERAEQRVLGVSHLLPGGVSLRVEGYERLIANPRAYSLNLIHASEAFPDAYEDRRRLVPERGRSRGVEFTAEYRAGKRWGWSASYAFVRSEERIAGRWVPKIRDQRHTLYLDITYVPAPKWQLSASWQYHTGWPITDVGYFMAPDPVGGEYPAFYYKATNATRLPGYHRLDLRATRRFSLRHGVLRAYVDLFNVYDRKNQYSYDHHFTVENGEIVVTRSPRSMFPFLPSAGLSWEF
ncbi:MAG: TonB-dependent receptor [Opitutaceae bacterium]